MRNAADSKWVPFPDPGCLMERETTQGGSPVTMAAEPVRILLVEDSRGDRRLVREYLRTAGPGTYVIRDSASLAEAFAQLKSGPTDLVLLDLGLPDSSGLSTLSAMRAAAPRIPIVVFTGTDDPQQALLAIQAGAQDYLVKGPLTKAAILRTVRYTLERYRLEDALRTSEEKFRTIADFTGDWEYWVRPDDTVVYMNPACRDITGHDAEEFMAEPTLVEKIVHPDDRGIFREHHRQAFGQGASLPTSECEFRIVRPDGTVRWMAHVCHPVVGPDGSNRGRRVSNRDVTAKKKAAAQTAQHLMQLASLLEISHYTASETHELLDFTLQQALKLTDSTIGYLMFYDPGNEELTLISWSRGVMETCGLEETKTRYRLGEVGLWGAPIRQGRSLIINDFAAPSPLKCGYPSGHLPLQRWLSVPVLHQGRIVAVVGLANKTAPYDETDVLQLSLLMEGAWRVKGEREAVEEVRRLNAKLEARVASRTAELDSAMRELESFSYSVSHDLRSPLRSLDGFSQALLEEYASRLDATGMSYLERIRSASRRMATLIDDLLHLSRVTRHSLACTPVDLSALAREVAAELRAESPERDATFAIEPGLVVQGDTHLLRIVLDNLLGNAWKFTSRTPGARIEFGSRVAGGGREFFVRDTGAGFDPDFADKLFVAFQRLHSEAEFPGTGIGLTIARRIVRRHGGDIRGEGRPGGGAEFAFTLPGSA